MWWRKESQYLKNLKYIGIAISKHKIYENCTVILYSTKFKPNKKFKKEEKQREKEEEENEKDD